MFTQTRFHPCRFWVSPEKTPQPFWEVCSNALSPHSKEVFNHIQMELSVFRFVSIASCHWTPQKWVSPHPLDSCLKICLYVVKASLNLLFLRLEYICNQGLNRISDLGELLSIWYSTDKQLVHYSTLPVSEVWKLDWVVHSELLKVQHPRAVHVLSNHSYNTFLSDSKFD